MSDTKKQEAINTFWEKMAINRVWRNTDKMSKLAFARNQEMFTEELATTCMNIGEREGMGKALVNLDNMPAFSMNAQLFKDDAIEQFGKAIDALLDNPEGETIAVPTKTEAPSV